MELRFLISGFLWVAFIATPTLVSAKTSNSTTIGISVVIPERAEDQQCVVGFENSIDGKFTSMQNLGCHYDSKKLLQAAYQRASTKNSQGFVTVVVTAP